MRYLLRAGSFLGLGLTVVPAFFVASGVLTWNTHAWLMGVGAVLWFVTAPFWMVKEEAPRSSTEA
ncbi:MAG: hypothetical protein PVH40_07330 [Gemmatimonadales bacterium]